MAASEPSGWQARWGRALLHALAWCLRALVLIVVADQVIVRLAGRAPRLDVLQALLLQAATTCVFAVWLTLLATLCVPLFLLLHTRFASAERVLGIGTGVWTAAFASLPTYAMLDAIAARRRLPFDFPVELDAALVLALTLACAGLAALCGMLARLLPAALAGSRIAHVLLLSAACVASLQLGEVRLVRIHAQALLPLCLAGSMLLAVLAAALMRIAPQRFEAALLVVLAVVGLLWLPRTSPLVRHALFQRTGLAQSAARWVSKTQDLDGDGYWARSVGGFDCDDDRFYVHPFAPDAPGNGLDENCTGRDAAPRSLELRAVAKGTERPDLLLITIDALAAGHLGMYGYARPTSRELDHWAKSAVVFERAYTTTPSTAFAMIALQSGRIPSAALESVSPTQQGVIMRGGLFGTLSSLGYQTTCIISEAGSLPVIGCQHVRAIAQGPGSLADVTVSETQLEQVREELLRPASEPRFVWVHLMEPHAEYIAYDAELGGGSAVDRYDGEIAHADQLLGKLFAELETAGRMPHLAILLCADHGEQLDGQALGHGPQLRDDLLHIPLLAWVPGARPQRIAAAVSLLDVYPTVLELAAARRQPGRLHGSSLLPAIMGSAALAPDRAVYVESFEGENKQIGLLDGEYLLGLDLSVGARGLYDLRRDPSSAVNLLGAQRERGQRFEQRLFHWISELDD